MITEPAPLVFEEHWADRRLTGMPLVESVTHAFVGRCQVCGRDADEQTSGSVLTNPGHVEGVLYGDTFCIECYDDDSDVVAFVLEPRAALDENERLA